MHMVGFGHGSLTRRVRDRGLGASIRTLVCPTIVHYFKAEFGMVLYPPNMLCTLSYRSSCIKQLTTLSKLIRLSFRPLCRGPVPWGPILHYGNGASGEVILWWINSRACQRNVLSSCHEHVTYEYHYVLSYYVTMNIICVSNAMFLLKRSYLA